MMIFDTHAHYDDDRFAPDRGELLSGMNGNGIGRIINVGASFEGCKNSLTLAQEHDFIYAALGVHPSDIADLTEESCEWIRQHLSEPKVVAVGEIGLDYYWDKEPEVQARQREWFRYQLQLAKESALPVSIHSREAAADTMEIMKEAAADGIPGVIHCYSYSKEQALEYVDMGYYIGVGGVVTFKNARKLKETVEAIPLERILLETDCPYMAPEPNRGKRNSSLYLTYVADAIAGLKGVTPEEVKTVTYENALRLFTKVR